MGGNGEAVAAIDATFSAPKSVSAVWALGSPDLRAGIERAHELAVGRALAYSVENVAMVRERIDQQTVIHTTAADVIATSRQHTTARAVEGRPPDPQLHSHVLVHGAARADGRIVATDSSMWFVHRRELGAADRTELAHELSQLGFRVQRGTGRGGRYFELQGVPQALLDRWSSRHHQVQQAINSRLSEKRAELEAIVNPHGLGAARALKQLRELRESNRLPASEDRYAAWSTRTAKGRQPTAIWTDTGHRLRACSGSTAARSNGFDTTHSRRCQRIPAGCWSASPSSTQRLISAKPERSRWKRPPASQSRRLSELCGG